MQLGSPPPPPSFLSFTAPRRAVGRVQRRPDAGARGAAAAAPAVTLHAGSEVRTAAAPRAGGRLLRAGSAVSRVSAHAQPADARAQGREPAHAALLREADARTESWDSPCVRVGVRARVLRGLCAPARSARHRPTPRPSVCRCWASQVPSRPGVRPAGSRRVLRLLPTVSGDAGALGLVPLGSGSDKVIMSDRI